MNIFLVFVQSGASTKPDVTPADVTDNIETGNPVTPGV